MPVILAAFALAAQPVGRTPEVVMRAAGILRFLEYEDCVRQKTTIDGAFTKVAPREVAHSAEPKCGAEWSNFRSTMLTGVEPSAGDLETLEYWRSLAIDSAASDLLEGRNGSCGTQPGPYACHSK